MNEATLCLEAGGSRVHNFWGPFVSARPGDTGGRKRRQGANECSIPCNAPQAKSLLVWILQAHRCTTAFLPRLSGNNLAF